MQRIKFSRSYMSDDREKQNKKTLQTSKNGLQRCFLASLGRFELPAFRLGGERSILLSYRDVYQIYSIFPLRRPSNYRPTVYINLSKLKNQAEFSILLSFSILFVTVRDIRCENRDKSKLNACFSLCFLAVLNCYYYI